MFLFYQDFLKSSKQVNVGNGSNICFLVFLRYFNFLNWNFTRVGFPKNTLHIFFHPPQNLPLSIFTVSDPENIRKKRKISFLGFSLVSQCFFSWFFVAFPLVFARKGFTQITFGNFQGALWGCVRLLGDYLGIIIMILVVLSCFLYF